MKRNVTKVLSILCLLVVLACAFIPCIKLTGEYMQLLNGITGTTQSIPEESITMIEQMLATQGITIDFKATMDSLSNLAVPLADGEITIMDFYTLSGNCEATAKQLSTLPIEGLGIPSDTTDPVQQALLPVSEMITSLATLGQTMSILSYIFLAPVGLFGLLAFAVIVRILLRLFNRRGLGVFITLLALLNAGLMVGIPYGIEMVGAEGLSLGAEATFVPYVLVGCALASCIIWAIGRGAKEKVVKEVPVEVPVETPAEPAPVVEEVPVEEVVEETVEVEEQEVVGETEEVVEETAEEVEE